MWDGKGGGAQAGAVLLWALGLEGASLWGSGAGGTCLGWGGSLRRWDNSGLGCELKVRAWDALVGWRRDLGRLRVWGVSSGSWAGDTEVQDRGLRCSQGVPRGPSRDPKCRQGSLGCRAGGLGVAKGLWCRPGLISMQSKGPGCSLSSWVWAGVLGAEQGSQGCRAGLSGGGRGPSCGSRLPQMQLGILGVQSRVLGHNQRAEGSRARVLGCNQGCQGCSRGARGAASGQCRSPGTGQGGQSPSAARPHRAGGGRGGRGRRT